MKNFLPIVILLLIISITTTYSCLYISFNLIYPENIVNQTVRKHIIASRVLKTIFRLYQIGDSRYDFMRNSSLPIVIHLYYQEGEQLEEKTIDKVVNEIFRITHKSQKIVIKKPVFLLGIPKRVNDTQMNRILDTYAKKNNVLSNNIPLNIFVLHEYERYPSYAGLVVDDNSLILFKKIITSVSDHQISPVPAEVSTILHEFAHLSGGPHIEKDGCILEEKIENINLLQKPTVFRDTYCNADIEAITKNL